MQLEEHPRQRPARHVKQGSVREHSVETAGRQIELEEVLLPDLAPGVRARHHRQALRALEPCCDVPEPGERLEIAPGTAAEIEYRVRWPAFDRPQQRIDVLPDVVIARSLPEALGVPVVMSPACAPS